MRAAVIWSQCPLPGHGEVSRSGLFLSLSRKNSGAEMAKSGWTDALAKFRGETKENLTQIVRKSAERVFEEAQRPEAEGGRMPVDEGDLRESLTFEGAGSGAESFRAAAAQMQPGDVLTGEWRSMHGTMQEFGFQHRNGKEIPGKFFATEAGNRFDEIVDEVAAEVVKK